MIRLIRGGLVLALAACSEDSKPASAPQTGDTPTGGKPSKASTGGGAQDSDAGSAPDDAGTPSCPPIGRYLRTNYMLSSTSDPRCKLKASAPTRFFGPIMLTHTGLIDGVLCTVSPDQISNGGCTLRRQVSCQDGTSSTTQCDLSLTDGRVSCVEQGEVTTLLCMAISEYVPDPTWNGPCAPIQGPYTRTSQLTEGSDCLPFGDAEVGDEAELALDPSCTFALPEAGGRCNVTVDERCSSGDGARHECTLNADSQRVMCRVTQGDCSYDVTLER